MKRLVCFLFGHRTVNDVLAERGFARIFPKEHAPCERCGKRFS